MKPILKISLVMLLLAILSIGAVAVYYDPLPDVPDIPYPSTELPDVPDIPYPSTELPDITITVVVDTPLLPENQINGDVYLVYIYGTKPYIPVTPSRYYRGPAHGWTMWTYETHELTGNTCTFVMPYHQYAHCVLGYVKVAGHKVELFGLPALDENQCDAEIHVSLTPTPESEQ